jgi:putative transposase
MPWSESSAMDSRLIFIAGYLREDEPMRQLCLRHGISRKTGYKWLGRYRQAGAAGLAELSSARHTLTQAMDPATAAAVLAFRERHPTWGARKLLERLGKDHPETVWPAASTVGDLLRREGISKPRRRQPGEPRHPPTLTDPSAPNACWAADFKGWFRTGDGVRCEPLTVSDGYSRYLLACEAVAQVTAVQVQPILTRLFQVHGLPQALRTDNGSPFARRDGLGGLTQLSVWLLKLDVWPERIEPGCPQQNGRHERMHRVLNEDTASPPAASLSLQQARMDAWRVEYNTDRPHEALGMECPDALYTASARAYPASIKEWEYPADHQVRRVIGDGYIKWRDGTVYLSGALRGETVGVAQRDDGDWAVRFRGFDLAVLPDDSSELHRCGLSRTPLHSVT